LVSVSWGTNGAQGNFYLHPSIVGSKKKASKKPSESFPQKKKFRINGARPFCSIVSTVNPQCKNTRITFSLLIHVVQQFYWSFHKIKEKEPQQHATINASSRSLSEQILQSFRIEIT
jgi:hypothetical protein